MDLRERLNSGNVPKISAAVAGVLVLALLIFWFTAGESGGASSRSEAQAFYTVDDGASWFEASAALVPPFQHEGKTACEVFVYSADGGKTEKAGYLQRVQAAAKKQLEANEKMPRSIHMMEVKAVGAGGTWVPQNSKAGMDIVNIKPPAGQAEIVVVTP